VLADKRKAVGLLLADPEWSQWSDREIGRRCQVDNKVVARLRHRACEAKPQMRTRKAQRGSSVCEMNVRARNASAPSRATDTPDDAAPTRDGAGIPVPESRKSVFDALTDSQEGKDLFERLAQALDRVARSPDGVIYRQDLIQTARNGQVFFACRGLRVSLGKLVAAEPYCCYCPTCHESHAGRVQPTCKTCGGRG
jgi:hypothetical protein